MAKCQYFLISRIASNSILRDVWRHRTSWRSPVATRADVGNWWVDFWAHKQITHSSIGQKIVWLFCFRGCQQKLLHYKCKLTSKSMKRF